MLSFKLRLPDYAYDEPERRVEFYRTFFDRLEAQPDIASAGAMSKLPGDGHRNRWGISLWRGEEPEWVRAEIRCVAGDAFETLTIPLLRGRGLGPSDVAGSEKVVLINQAMADQYFEASRHWVTGCSVKTTDAPSSAWWQTPAKIPSRGRCLRSTRRSRRSLTTGTGT